MENTKNFSYNGKTNEGMTSYFEMFKVSISTRKLMLSERRL